MVPFAKGGTIGDVVIEGGMSKEEHGLQVVEESVVRVVAVVLVA